MSSLQEMASLSGLPGRKISIETLSMTDRTTVFEQLKNLLTAQFNEVQTRFGLPPAFVRQAATQAEQAVDLLRYAEQEQPTGLARLASLIAEVLPDKAQLVGRAPAELHCVGCTRCKHVWQFAGNSPRQRCVYHCLIWKSATRRISTP